MDWRLIQTGNTPKQRIALFLSLQQYRYGHSPQKAALALWKGHFSYDIGKLLFADIQRLNGDVSYISELQQREYLTHLLTALAQMQCHADSAGRRQS